MTVRQELATSVLTDLLFEEPGVGRCLVAPDGSVLRVNAEWLRSTGFTLDDVLGADIVSLFPATRDMSLAMHARARAGHRVDVPLHAQAVNGRETWWEGCIVPVPMQGGTGLLITAREVPADVRDRTAELERLAAEARLNTSRLQALVATIPAGVMVTNARGQFTLVNDDAEKLFGGVTGDAFGPDGGYTLATPDGRPFPKADLPLVRALRGESTRSVEMVAKRADGTERVLFAAGAPVRHESGAIAGAIAVLQDITDRKREEAALRHSEERFRLLTDAMPQIVCSVRPDGTPEYVNPSWVTYSGLDLEATARAGWERVLHPEDVPVAVDCLRRTLKSRGPADVELRYLGADGTYRWFLSRLAPVVESGRVVRLVGAAMDIDDRKRAEEALGRAEAAFEHAGKLARFGAWWVDLVGDMQTAVTRWSDEVYRIFGYEPGEVQVSFDLWNQHVHPDDRARVHDAILAALATGESYAMEHRIVRRDGVERIVAVHGEAGNDASGRPVSMAGAVQDITERKRIEQELREGARRKDEFLGMLSHELRNPLAPIRNSTFILRRAAPGSEQARRAQAVIERQTEHLARLVDDLLDVTRIARGRIELRRARVDLRELVVRTAEDFRSLFQDRGVAFRVEVPGEAIWAVADRTRIAQTVGNLLHNAAKFTRAGDQVTVSSRVREGNAEIRVRDTGAGIEPALLPRVFEAFTQGERTLARSEGGLGLGLALVKGLTELHGGSVQVQSGGTDQGSEFTITLPLSSVLAAPEPPRDAVRRPAARRSVLVVDDNVDAAETLAEVVTMLGHEVEIAYDGPTAVEKARASAPSVVLCDLGLPGMSGYDVAKALRAGGTDALLVALTGYARPEDVNAAVEAGFDRHLAKPATIADIELLLP